MSVYGRPLTLTLFPSDGERELTLFWNDAGEEAAQRGRRETAEAVHRFSPTRSTSLKRGVNEKEDVELVLLAGGRHQLAIRTLRERR